jgi:uncharacterized protein YgbK (DUF1537 family)
MMNELLLTYYGDDFTGSTDVMEALTLGGVATVLFLEPPTPTFVAQHFPHIQALGVAGISRSLSPMEMDAELPPIFAALAAFNAPLFHYKICSTFDSSPTVGSIGHAIEIGLRQFRSEVVPLMVGAPILRRYVAFGNLFATIDEETYRIDRHPTMCNHPITPMDEGDLRLHLSRQTARKIGLVDLRHLIDAESLQRRWRNLTAAGCQIILFDTLDGAHLLRIGEQMWSLREAKTAFLVGSSGVEYALIAHWQGSNFIQPPPPPRSPGAVEQIAVISGSAAPQTAAQCRWAMDHGFVGIRLDSTALIDSNRADSARHNALSQALDGLRAGKSVLLYSALGPDDPAIPATKTALATSGFDPQQVSAHLGTQQGMLLRELLENHPLRRVCVSGGDTCGYAARQLGIYALELVMPIAPGSPLCRARSHRQAFDGLEISLKAGQVGKPDYFGSLLSGQV